MAQFFVNGKLYDTDTAIKVIGCEKEYTSATPPITFKTKATLYKTEKGNWFTILKTENEGISLIEETEETARELLIVLNAFEAYRKYIGPLEEA